MLYACIVLGITTLVLYKKGFKRKRSIGTQTPLKALLNRGIQTDEYALFGIESESESEEVGMHICSGYFGYASDDDSFFSVLQYSDNDQTQNIHTISDPPPSQQPQHLP